MGADGGADVFDFGDEEDEEDEVSCAGAVSTSADNDTEVSGKDDSDMPDNFSRVDLNLLPSAFAENDVLRKRWPKLKDATCALWNWKLVTSSIFPQGGSTKSRQ